MNFLLKSALHRASCGVVMATLAAAAVAQPAGPVPVAPPCSPAIGAKAAAPGQSAAIPGLPDRVVAPREPHRYLYFPAREIYYAPETLQWFWQSGGRWNYGSNLPLDHGPEVGVAGVLITLMTERPYQEHAEVVRKYGNRNHVNSAEERQAAEGPAEH